MTTIVKDSYTLMLGDCLERMREIPDGSVDMVLADLPYGTTGCKWDVVIPWEPLWEHYWRVLRTDGAVVLFGSQPFTSVLTTSQIKYFKYEWIWEKAVGSNFALLKYQPMKEHENILVFSRKTHRFFPIRQPRKGKGLQRVHNPYHSNTSPGEAANGGMKSTHAGKQYDDLRAPSSVQYFNNRDVDRGLHPTQKPVSLLEYLVRSYTEVGDTVLDCTMGSGSTGAAAIQTGRRFVGVEKEPAYFEIAAKRLAELPAPLGDTTSASQQSPAYPDDSEPSVHDVSAVPGSC